MARGGDCRRRARCHGRRTPRRLPARRGHRRVGARPGHGHARHAGHAHDRSRFGSQHCAGVAQATRQAACEDSVLPSRFPAMAMGVPDHGVTHSGHGGMGPAVNPVSLDDLHGPTGTPDRTFDLTAATGSAVLGGVRTLTFNGQTPGPTLSVRQGELVEVRLHNSDVVGGVTIHWHGVDVPGAEDGVAGVTQDAVLPGQESHVPIRRPGRRNVLVPHAPELGPRRGPGPRRGVRRPA